MHHVFLSNKLNASDRFLIKEVIGDKPQGRIYHGIDKLTNKYVSIKETWKMSVELNECRQGTKIQENYINEINILNYVYQLSDCPSTIISILSTWNEELCYIYAMEYCPCSLFNYIKTIIHEISHMKIYCNAMKKLAQRTMNYNECINNPYLTICSTYIHKIIKLPNAVSYLHSKSIVHLDLSLENVMLNNLDNNHINNPSIKIIDFGLSKYLPNNKFTLKNICGKLSYMSPEVYMDNTYYDLRNANIWSMDIMLFIMLVGTYLIDKASNDPKFCYIIKNGIKPLLNNWRRLRYTTSLYTLLYQLYICSLYNYYSLINDDALDLLNKIFVPECNRINIKQLLSHPFLNPNRYIIEMTNTNATIDSEMYDNDIEYTLTPSLAPSIADSSTTDNTIDYQLNDEIFMIADEDKSNNNIYPLYGFDNAFRLITTAIITPIGTSIIISMIKSFSKSTTIVYHKCINYNNGNTSVYYTV